MCAIQSSDRRSGVVARHGKAIIAAVALLILGAFVMPKPLPAAPTLSARLAAATLVSERTSTGGYWLVSADGKVTAFGGAHLYGSMAGQPLSAPIIGIVATDDGLGYWLYAKDGGVFSFGDAAFVGSLGGSRLSTPIVGMAASHGSVSPPSAGSGSPGLPGDTGPTGPQGLAGVAGPTGSPGPTGSTGPAGATGATGATGSIVGSACTKGSTPGTITQDVNPATGAVLFTCVVATLVMSNASISGGWGVVTGTGLMPGNTLSECWNLNPSCSPSSPTVASDGTADSAPNGALFACGFGITDAYFKGFTVDGDPIESNHVNASC